ncbi:MAG: OmpA family protein [Parvularcula sp.]|jgi:outer membrane protein OmpA-like peptidoglycan-associated protein|nr:OmpA family protein [Parvularcula sp.]
MMKRFLLAASVGTLALGVASAQTSEDEGFYGLVGIGAVMETENNDFESEGAINPAPFDTEVQTEIGSAAYVGFGKHLAGGFRGEFELGWRKQDVASLPSQGGFGGFPGDDIGEVRALTGMVNILKDFGGAEDRLRPYVGVGFGVAQIDLDLNNSADVNPAPFAGNAPGLVANGYRVNVDDDDLTTAVQGLIGLTYEMTERVDLDLGYRFLQTGEYDYEAVVNNANASVTGEMRFHEVRAGLRFNFGAAPAPAPRRAEPAPQPQPQTKTCFDGSVVPMGTPCPTVAEEDQLTPAELRTVVYFEFDRADLTDQAQDILRRRASEAQTVNLIEVLVSGNTDTSGSASYNQQLSARRAEVVRNALINYGVASNKIRVRALGESNLAKPTADGVREPLNRRTEVDFDF